MNFAEALMLFTAKWLQIRAAYGQHVAVEERIDGYTHMLLLELAGLKPESRSRVREAIKSALDDDAPVAKSELN